jgi:hypothetical protein
MFISSYPLGRVNPPAMQLDTDQALRRPSDAPPLPLIPIPSNFESDKEKCSQKITLQKINISRRYKLYIPEIISYCPIYIGARRADKAHSQLRRV